MTVNETRIRVRYAETDQMGVVYHSNYFIWFEVGRVELLRQLGFTYKEMERQDQCFIAVVDARCRFRAPARYDEVRARRELTSALARLEELGFVRKVGDEPRVWEIRRILKACLPVAELERLKGQLLRARGGEEDRS
jgi:acyl-CoA thioester hydrolase